MSQVTTISRKRNACAIVALACGIAACEVVVNEVRVEPGNTPLKPVLVLSDTTGRAPSGAIYGLSVVACQTDSVLWQIAASGSNGAPQRIVYGEAPPGYVVNTGPATLRAGCYNVFITDGRRARFHVDAMGHVTTEARPDTTHR